MSVLKQKLDKAAEQFQIHNFKQSLALYEDCLAFCHRTRQSYSIIYNIMTTKGALLSILGELQKAMSTLNEVIKNDSSHYLALIRRSQVYKKRGKLNLALRDIQMVSAFCPDNLQIAAMRIEIENMKSKSKAANSSQESQSEEDEETMLNFSNLKKIDRKSCSIVITDGKGKGRKSWVTITGDTAVEYQREDDGDKSAKSTQVSREQMREKYCRVSKEIELEKDVPAAASKIVAKPNNRCKSILKNKCSIQNSFSQEDEESYPVRESKLIDKLKNIDGKVISSNHSIEAASSQNVREVEFRKSLFNSQEREFVTVMAEKPAKQGRKSCLKNPSFELQEGKEKERLARRSKFQMLSRKSIDGVVIKNRKSVDEIKQFAGEKGKEEEVSDQGSSYNIFGSKDSVEISKEIKQKLGITMDDRKEKKTPKARTPGGKSILKKNSVLVHNVESEQRGLRGLSSEVRDTSEEKAAKKPKKSVMFTKSRFAE